MARKDLLKKAFRNNFIRKSVADLKSLTIDRTPKLPRKHASSASLRFTYDEAAPVIPTPRTGTLDFPAHENTITEEKGHLQANAKSVSPVRTSTGETPNEVAQWAESIDSDSVRISASEVRRHEEKVLEHGSTSKSMSSSQVQYILEKADPEHKAKIESGLFLRGHDQLVSDCHDLFVGNEEMVLSHLDTIDTTLAILEAITQMSPHIAALREEMLEKKQMCKETLIGLLPVRSRLEEAKAGKGYA